MRMMRRGSMMCLAMPAMPMMMMARMMSSWSCGGKGTSTPRPGRDWTAGRDDASCGEPKPARLKNVVETARAAGSFGTLLEALKVAKLDVALAGAGPFTVFAPSDAAFAKVPAEALERLLANPAELAKLLKLHVVGARLTSAELAGVGSLRTLSEQTLSVDTTDGARIGTARVVQPDIACGNGVIHVIDSVLLPA
jgi:uncharacterized surface protein with fasciclin (FAS1) repeats